MILLVLNLIVRAIWRGAVVGLWRLRWQGGFSFWCHFSKRGKDWSEKLSTDFAALLLKTIGTIKLLTIKARKNPENRLYLVDFLNEFFSRKTRGSTYCPCREYLLPMQGVPIAHAGGYQLPIWGSSNCPWITLRIHRVLWIIWGYLLPILGASIAHAEGVPIAHAEGVPIAHAEGVPIAHAEGR